MASAVVTGIVGRAPAATGMSVLYEVSFLKDDGTVDTTNVPVTITADDSDVIIKQNIVTAVRARAAELGYNLPTGKGVNRA